jgi:hypothetical protein
MLIRPRRRRRLRRRREGQRRRPRARWRYVGGNNFQPDRNADAVIDKVALRGLAAVAGQELTYTCVPPGSGVRIGLDRDEDGVFDRRELDCGYRPGGSGELPDCFGRLRRHDDHDVSTSSTSSTSTLEQHVELDEQPVADFVDEQHVVEHVDASTSTLPRRRQSRRSRRRRCACASGSTIPASRR